MARLLPNGLAITTTTSQKVSKFLGQRSQPQGAHSLTLALSRLYAPRPFLVSLFQYVFVSLLSRDSVYDMLRKGLHPPGYGA